MMRRARKKDAHCFLRGTKILTVGGERNVEDLVVGESLATEFGGRRRIESVARYAHERVDDAPWALHERPVRIRAGAIAQGIPHRDLLVSSWHAVFVDGALIPAGNLVNGKSIFVDAAADMTTLEYFHVRLEKHDVIYAEGLGCESLMLEGDARLDTSMPALSAEQSCAPVMFYNGRKGMIASRLRSAVSPWVDLRRDIDVIRDRIESRVY